MKHYGPTCKEYPIPSYFLFVMHGEAASDFMDDMIGCNVTRDTPPIVSFSIMEPRPNYFWRTTYISCGVKDHGLGSSLDSHNIFICEGKNMKNKYLATTSLFILTGITILLILAPEYAVSESKVKVAGFQIDPTVNGGQDPGIVEWVDFVPVNCFAPYDVFGFFPEYGENNRSIAMAGLGEGAVTTGGLVGTLEMIIHEPGDYVLGGDKILVGDTSARPVCNPVGCGGKVVFVQECSNGDGNDTCDLPVNFYYEPMDPVTVCAGEPFVVDLYISIPSATEYNMLLDNYFLGTLYGKGVALSHFFCISWLFPPNWSFLFPSSLFFLE